MAALRVAANAGIVFDDFVTNAAMKLKRQKIQPATQQAFAILPSPVTALRTNAKGMVAIEKPPNS